LTHLKCLTRVLDASPAPRSPNIKYLINNSIMIVKLKLSLISKDEKLRDMTTQKTGKLTLPDLQRVANKKTNNRFK